MISKWFLLADPASGLWVTLELVPLYYMVNVCLLKNIAFVLAVLTVSPEMLHSGSVFFSLGLPYSNIFLDIRHQHWFGTKQH